MKLGKIVTKIMSKEPTGKAKPSMRPVGSGKTDEDIEAQQLRAAPSRQLDRNTKEGLDEARRRYKEKPTSKLNVDNPEERQEWADRIASAESAAYRKMWPKQNPTTPGPVRGTYKKNK